MDRKLELEKGQEVTIRYINDTLRYINDKSIDNISEWAVNGEVTKVGRKYIEVKFKGRTEKFEIEFDYVQKTNIGSPDYKLYLSKKEIINEIKIEELYSKVKNCFDSWYNNNEFTSSQLERILNIVNENKEN